MDKKAVTYVRVSSKEQAEQGYSPDAQKRLLWDFARRNGFDVVQEFEEAETAKQAGRRAFDAMLGYVREHGIKNILVEKTDRLQRNFKDFVEVDELMKTHDVTVHHVKEGTSISKDSNSFEKFMHGINVLSAKRFIDNLSEETKKGMVEKVEQGEYPSKALLGYKNVRDPLTTHNVIAVDEANAPLMREMFRLYATGEYSLLALIEKLEGMGLTQNLPAGRRLNKTTVSKLLHQPFYIGNFAWGKKVHKGKHPAIIDFDTWQKAQEVLAGKNINKAKKHDCIPFAFKGLLTCGECGRSVTAELKKGRYVYYRCTKYERHCSQRPVKEETIGVELEHLFQTLKLSENGLQFVLAGLKQSLEVKRASHDTEFETMVREQSTLKNRLDRLYEDRLDGKVTDAFYDQKAKEYTARLETLERSIAQHNRADVDYYDFGVKILELAEKADFLYKAANPEEKQEFLHFLLSNSTLKDGKPEFALKMPFSAIAKRSPLEERSAWGGQRESNPQ